MKRNMLWSFLLLLMVSLVACSDSKDDQPVAAKGPEMLTFGFYAADNAGRLGEDYVAAVTTASPSTISLSLPTLVDVTHLVARFTSTDGTQVLVNGDLQQSGTTAHNFSLPVDYFVTDGRLWQRYEVRVIQQKTMQWQELPQYFDYTLYSICRLAYDPVGQHLYMAYKGRKDASGADDLHAHLLRLSDDQTSWVNLGMSTNTVYSSYLGFDVSAEGHPYVSYGNYDLKPYSTNVERVDDEGHWTMVGQNLEGAQTNYLGMAALSDNRIITSMVGNTSGVYYRTNATSIYDGSKWTVANGPCGGMMVYKCTMAKHGNRAYLAVMNRNDYTIHIYEYAAGEWTELDGYQESGLTNGIGQGAFKLTTDTEGNVYMLNADNQTSGSYYIKLRKYDQATKTWSTVSGNPTPIDAHDTHIYVDVAIAPNGTPFLAYNDLTDPSNCLKVIYLDPETRQWTAPHTICADKVANDVCFIFTPASQAFVSFGDANSHVRVFSLY